MLSKNEKGYHITPTVINMRENVDVWPRFGQEQGVIEPRLYVTTNERIIIDNPYATQKPHFMALIMHAFDYSDKNNYDIMPTLDMINNLTDIKISQDENALVFKGENVMSFPVYNENALPEYSIVNGTGTDDVSLWDGITVRKGSGQYLDMKKHRGIGIYIEGDNSGCVLVFQIPGRDYAVHINCAGVRYVEIPNGEAAWCMAQWGWRMSSWKYIDYSKIFSMHVAIGRINANSSVNIRVWGMKALYEHPVTLKNPTLHINQGYLTIKDSVKSDEQIRFRGGNTADICDLSWNVLRTASVTKNEFVLTENAVNMFWDDDISTCCHVEF